MEDRSAVAAVILAAGFGRRFGGPKVRATLGGETLLSRVATLAREAGLEPVIAVVPRDTDASVGVEAVVNPDPQRGLSSSLQLGIAAVPLARPALVLLVDQPTMASETIAAVLAARGTHPIIAARADDRLAPPVLLEPEAFPVVARLRGDTGLREVLQAHPELVAAVDVPAHAPDIDTQADLARLEAG